MTQDAPGFLLTERRVLTQKIFVNLDPRLSIERKYNISYFQLVEFREWYNAHVDQAQARVRDILDHARKPFIDHPMVKSKRPKRFFGFLIASLVFTALGTVVATTTTIVNSVSIKTLQTEMENLKNNIEFLHQEVEAQKANMERLVSVVNNIVVTTDLHSELISRSTRLHESHERFKYELLFLKDPIMFHTLMFLDEVQSGINDLLRGRVPLYFVSREVIRKMLLEVGEDATDILHINLSFEMGSAMPLYIDPERMEACFLLAIPYMASKNVFQMKYIHNVGTFQDGFHVKIQTPEIVTYQPWEPEELSIPILTECVKFKDHNYQCEGKPFVYDVTRALCGMEYLRHGSETCEVTFSKTQDNFSVKARLVGNKWLVSTTEKEANIYFKELVQNKKVLIPTPVILVKVPKDTRVVIGDVTLYPVGDETWESEIRVVDAFQGREIPMNPDLKFLLDNKPNHTIGLLIREGNLTINTLKYSPLDHQMLSTHKGPSISEMVMYVFIIGLIVWLIMLSRKMRQLKLKDTAASFAIWMKREGRTPKRNRSKEAKPLA